jgi:mannose-6-phosphate isomerase-like protein (cupin superfamily)|tara:strand:- start:1515 stop:1967 length:453 start_codon:yes stop_codon:yes gene_type:complete
MTTIKKYSGIRLNKIPIFKKPKNIGKRPWGKEELLVLIPKKLMLKRLFIKAGSKGGLQYHQKKDECGILLSGLMIVRFIRKGKIVEKKVKPGDCFHFPTGVVHQEEAIKDCTIIEGSTTIFNDRVRVEELFGMSSKKGLPTTTKNQIIIK